MILLLLACNTANSCAEYVAAAAACTAEAGQDPAPYDEASICGEWRPALENVYGDWYACKAAAWAGPCPDEAAVDAAIDADAACALE